jgi:hypothetical protein
VSTTKSIKKGKITGLINVQIPAIIKNLEYDDKYAVGLTIRDHETQRVNEFCFESFEDCRSKGRSEKGNKR